MLVTPSGIVILVRLVHNQKASRPMLMTPSGIVILVRLVQSLKAFSPMLVTGLPSIVLGMISSPEAAVSQSVIVIELPLSVQLSGLACKKPFPSKIKKNTKIR